MEKVRKRWGRGKEKVRKGWRKGKEEVNKISGRGIVEAQNDKKNNSNSNCLHCISFRINGMKLDFYCLPSHSILFYPILSLHIISSPFLLTSPRPPHPLLTSPLPFHPLLTSPLPSSLFPSSPLLNSLPILISPLHSHPLLSSYSLLYSSPSACKGLTLPEPKNSFPFCSRTPRCRWSSLHAPNCHYIHKKKNRRNVRYVLVITGKIRNEVI